LASCITTPADKLNQVDADLRPSHVGPPFTGHFKILCDTPRGLQPWQPAADPAVTAGRPSRDTEEKAAAAPLAKTELNLEVGRNIYEASAKGTKLNKTDAKTNGDAPTANGVQSTDELTKVPIPTVHCHHCGVDCTRIYYHSSHSDANAKAKYELCPSCFLEGRLPSNHTSSHYTRTENPAYSSVVDRDAPWSDAELLRLLEGVERFDDDWSQIAEHVATRTRDECAVQFLQLDIEDKYVASDPPMNAPIGLQMLGSDGGHLPFNQIDNPVLSVAGFLASLADPATTAAAAGKSVAELRSRILRKLEKEPEESKEEAPEANAKGKEKESGDSMEVDGEQESAKAVNEPAAAQSDALKTLATVPLASIAARSGGLASHEEREMTRLVSAAVNVTLQKLELKLKYFNEMESILQAERRELERGRQQLFLDRLAFKRRVRAAQEGFKAAAATGGDAGYKLAGEVLNGEAAAAARGGYGFQDAAGGGPGSYAPLSAEGQIKSYEA
jgi:SWI/SNF related-matrix-associated actin-dependent regulator of chromatin subfamily C